MASQAPGAVSDAPGQHSGTGFIFQLEPLGVVPTLRNVALTTDSRPDFVLTIVWLLPQGTGVRWKHSSVSGSSAGQSRK